MTKPERRHVARLVCAYSEIEDLARLYSGIHLRGAPEMRQSLHLVAQALALELAAWSAGTAFAPTGLICDL